MEFAVFDSVLGWVPELPVYSRAVFPHDELPLRLGAANCRFLNFVRILLAFLPLLLQNGHQQHGQRCSGRGLWQGVPAGVLRYLADLAALAEHIFPFEGTSWSSETAFWW